MKEKKNAKRFRSMLAGLLALVLALTPVLTALPAIEASAAEAIVWNYVSSGSGNGNAHTYSDASTSPAAALLNTDSKMPVDGQLSLKLKMVDVSSSRFGIFYTYLDDNHWIYVGCNPNGSWYYQWRNGSSESYPSLSLPAMENDTEYDISISISHEVLVVKVNDSTVTLNDQNLYTVAEAINGEGKVGFRGGSYNSGADLTQFRFRDFAISGTALSNDSWSFLADCTGQVFETEEPIALYDVTGTVASAKDNAPIAGASVRIGDETATTAEDGTYTLSVPSGTYTMSVSAKGYAAASKDITVADANLTVDTVYMQDKAEVEYDNYISSETMKVAVSDTFPQVMQYVMLAGAEKGKVFLGQEEVLSTIEINNKAITPTMNKVTIGEDNAVYEMSLVNTEASIDLDMDVKISVEGNNLTWEVTDIEKKAGCAKINTIKVPKLNLVTISDEQADTQFKGATISGDTNNSGDQEITFAKGFTANASSSYAYGFVSADGLSAGVWSNSEAASDKRLTRNNGTNTIGLTSAHWYYEYGDLAASANYDGTPLSELPCAKVCITGDANEDGTVDWQDGAIAYREIMNNPYGWENVKDLVNYRISMNFSSQATNPYLKTADNIKKVYLATDGLGQAVMMKGYGSEGHDSANSEYGNIAERLGGVEELKELNTIAHQYNTQMGIHINAQEAYPEAQSFNDALINGTSSKGWGWLDQSYTINRTYDLGSGTRYKRLLQLYDQLNDTSLYANAWPGVVGEGEDETVADAQTIAETVAAKKQEVTTNLDFMYLDVWYGDSWETRKIAQQFNSLGWRFSTEFGYEGEYDSTWQHWATEGHYGGSSMKGLNSDVIRFIRNHQKDSFVLNWPSYGGAADNPLLGGYDLAGFEGWGSNNNFDDYLTRTWAVNLPTKFLQHYEVYKWVNYEDVGEESPVGNHEKEITLKNTDGDVVVVTRNEEQRSDKYVERTITLNGKKVLDDVTYLLPWMDSETNEEKLYHYNLDGGITTWELQDDWADLANVVVYKLTDNGRTDKQTVAVEGGFVTLTAEAGVAYIVLKGDEAPKTVATYSEGAKVVDTGFNSYVGTNGGSSLSADTWTGDIADESIKVQRVKSGNNYLVIDSPEKDVAVSTTISDLTVGENYVAQIYVDNKCDAKATLEVANGAQVVSNYTEKSIANNYVRCDAHNVNAVSNSKMQVMLVSFKAEAATATFTLKREAGEGVTYFDDIRIVHKTLDNIQEDGTFTQDFESVVGGIYPFVIGPSEGVNDQTTHLSEKHAPYTQSGWGNVVTDDVLDGSWSLKYHGNSTGLIYRTIPQNLHLEAGVTYNVKLDYQAGCANSYYFVIGDGDTIVEQLPYLSKTAVGVGQAAVTETLEFQVTGSESGQTWFGLYCGTQTETGSYGQNDCVIDNLVVKQAPMSVPGTLTMCGIGDMEEIEVSFTDGVDREITWTSSNEEVVTVDAKGHVKAIGIGAAEVTATVTIDGETVTGTCAVQVIAEELEVQENQFAGVWANTEETSSETAPASYIIDGNTSSFWHTNYSTASFTVSASNPAILTVELKDGANSFDGFQVYQRPSGNNGLITKYEYVIGNSFDEATNTVGDIVNNGTVTVSGGSANAGGVSDVRLPETVSGKYLQIRILAGSNGFGAMGELRTYTVTNYDEAWLTADKAAALEEANAVLAEAEAAVKKTEAELAAARAAEAEASTDLEKAEAAVKKAEAELAAAKAAAAKADAEADVYFAEAAANYAASVYAQDSTEAAAKAAAAEAALAKEAAAKATASEQLTKAAAAEQALAAAKQKLEEAKKNGQATPIIPPTVDELKAGDSVIYKKVEYKVLDAAKKTVAAVKGTNKKATKVTIAATVKIKGVSCTVVQIGANAFKGYAKLKSVTIGKNVKTIGKQSFNGCKKLSKVIFKGTQVKSIKGGAFKKTASKVTVKVPKSMKKKQRTALQKKLRKAGMKKVTVK